VIGVALVGAGVMGSVHGRSANSFAGLAHVTRVFDTDAARAATIAEQLGAAPADSMEAAITSDDVDAVVISVPPRYNRAAVELALQHGRSVFVEKPIALDRADAEAIVETVDRTGGRLMVGHVLRFWPGYPEVHAIATGGTLGRPVAVACTRLQPPPATTGWLADVEATGGIGPLVLVHDFDLMNWILGTPTSVSSIVLRGSGAGASHVVVGVDYDGARGVVEGSVAMPTSHPFSTSLSVYCERGSVHFGYDVEPSEPGSARDASQITPALPPVIRIHPDGGEPARIVPVDSADPWLPEMEYFLKRVADDAPIELGTPHQALAALDVAIAATASFSSGGPVRLQAERD
jgi:predicted dehydrogenase